MLCSFCSRMNWAKATVEDVGNSVHFLVLNCRKWEGGDPGVAHQKTPTSLLLTPEGLFHSFGYTARDSYHDLDPEEARDWLYFEKFKMKIHSTSVSSSLSPRLLGVGVRGRRRQESQPSLPSGPPSLGPVCLAPAKWQAQG